MTHEVHDDGETWSASLWQLRGLLGRKVGDTLVLAHHFLLKKNASFEDAANGLILADKNPNSERNQKAIRDVCVRRGILPNPRRRNRRAGAKFDNGNTDAAAARAGVGQGGRR